MLKGPFVRGTGSVSALDAEMKRHGHYAGYAAFDAALVLELAPIRDDPAFWDALATRFGQAEKLLAASTLPNAAADEKISREQAAGASATAFALRGKH